MTWRHKLKDASDGDYWDDARRYQGDWGVTISCPGRQLIVQGKQAFYQNARVRVPGGRFWRPVASKLSGASQWSCAWRTADHSSRVRENQAVSRLRPLTITVDINKGIYMRNCPLSGYCQFRCMG